MSCGILRGIVSGIMKAGPGSGADCLESLLQPASGRLQSMQVEALEVCNCFPTYQNSLSLHGYCMLHTAEEWSRTPDASSRRSSSSAQRATERCASQPAVPTASATKPVTLYLALSKLSTPYRSPHSCHALYITDDQMMRLNGSSVHTSTDLVPGVALIYNCRARIQVGGQLIKAQ